MLEVQLKCGVREYSEDEFSELICLIEGSAHARASCGNWEGYAVCDLDLEKVEGQIADILMIGVEGRNAARLLLPLFGLCGFLLVRNYEGHQDGTKR